MKQKYEENMNKLYLLFLLIIPLILMGELNSKIELNKLTFKNDYPGVYEKDYSSITNKKVNESPNYYMRMSFFTGNKSYIISGNGNETMKDISEWNYIENSISKDSVEISGQKVLLQKSEFCDNKEIGINVIENIYQIEGSDAVVFEYEVTNPDKKSEPVIGCFFDFDIPDEDNQCNPYNDEVIVDNKSRFIYMCNKDKYDNSMVPSIYPLDSDVSYYVYDVKNEMYQDEVIWRTLNENKTKTGKFNTKKSDYRFIVYKKDDNKTGSLKFSFVLFHSYGKKSVEDMTSEMAKYIISFAKLSQKNIPIETKSLSSPDSFILSSNYPNPFNPTTKFKISIPEQSNLSLQIYDMTGKLIRTLHTGQISSGVHQFEWNAQNVQGVRVASGVYFLKAESAGIVKMNKLMLIQ